LSAQGLLVAEIRYDFRQTHIAPVTSGTLDEVEVVFAALEQKARDALKGYGVAETSMVLKRSADMRYHHQATEIAVALPSGSLKPDQAPEIVESFHGAHEKRYGSQDRAAAVEFVTLIVSATTNTREEGYAVASRPSSGKSSVVGRRSVYFRDAGRTECELHDRELFAPGAELDGPALIESADSTVIVPPGWRMRCDTSRNLLLTRKTLTS
jgi:N-methylhydantoinase A